jgi:hypothetical protein
VAVVVVVVVPVEVVVVPVEVVVVVVPMEVVMVVVVSRRQEQRGGSYPPRFTATSY